MPDPFENQVGGSPSGEPSGTPAEGTASRVPSAEDPGALPQDGSAAAESAGGSDAVTEDLEELTAKAQKADEYLELAQRTKADFENFRKRATRDAALAQERGIAKLAKELLPAIDNLDRAMLAYAQEEHNGAEEPQLLSGIKLVHSELLAALARGGIAPYAPTGEPFDPQLHEAVAQHHLEGAAPGTVIEVYQQGYRLGDTVLRPARVLVAA